MRLWLVFALETYSAVLLAEPSISIQTRYYPVFGEDSRAIWQSIQRNGPTGKDGKRYHAYTKWNASWGYRWVETRDRCHLTSISVNVEIEYLLPKLKTPTFRQPDSRQKWDRYFEALFRHEQQHKDFGVEAARELDARLAKVGNQRSCTRLKNLLEQTAQRVIDEYTDKERAFDRATDHGANQGVVLR